MTAQILSFPSSRFPKEILSALYRRAEETRLIAEYHPSDSGDAMSFLEPGGEDAKWGVGRCSRTGRYHLIDRRGRNVVLTVDLGAVLALIR